MNVNNIVNNYQMWMIRKVLGLLILLSCLMPASNAQEMGVQVAEQIVENFEINLGYFLAITLLIFLIIA